MQALRRDIAAIDPAGFDAITQLRHKFLARAGCARSTPACAIVGGQKFPFDEESRLVFDAVAPDHTAAYFDALLAELDKALPGEGPVAARYQAFRNQFVHSAGETRRRVPRRHCRGTRPHAAGTSRCRPTRASSWST